MQDLIMKLSDKNNLNYNILKVVEEATELNEVLIKYITKSDDKKPSIDKIIEESGDVIARLGLLLSQLDIMDKVEARTLHKLEQIENSISSTILTVERQ